jgi:hypothetical protein
VDADGEKILVSRYASLLETSDGYEIVQPGRATPDRFPLTDEGFDAATDLYDELTRQGRIGRLLGPMVVVGIVAGLLWVSLELGSAILYAIVAVSNHYPDGLFAEIVGALSPFFLALNALFVVTVGAYATLWLYRRGMPPARTRR